MNRDLSVMVKFIANFQCFSNNFIDTEDLDHESGEFDCDSSNDGGTTLCCATYIQFICTMKVQQ